MYELLKRIDFSKKSHNAEKQYLSGLFAKWVSSNYPEINTIDTYFSDALFIGNNPSLGLDIVEVMMDEHSGRERYFSKLITHFEKKGYSPEISFSKAKDYLARFDLLKKFLDEEPK